MADLMPSGAPAAVRGARPLALPVLSRHAAAQANLLARASGPVTVRLGPAAVTVQPPRAAVTPGCDWTLGCELDGQPLTLGFPHGTLSLLLRVLEPALNLQPPPLPSIMALLADTLLHPLLPAWQGVLGCQLAVIGVEAGPPAASNGFLVSLSIAGHAGYVFAAAGPAADALLARWPAATNPLGSLPIQSTAYLGATILPLDVVASLRDGDAVLLQARPPGGALVLFGPGWGSPAHWQDGSIVLSDAPGPLSHQADTLAMPSNDGSTLDSLPVRLDFNVGRAEMTLAELRTLEAGSILPLAHSSANLVEITVNGRRVGTGELVEVEGAVAVRLTGLFGLG